MAITHPFEPACADAAASHPCCCCHRGDEGAWCGRGADDPIHATTPAEKSEQRNPGGAP